MRNLGWLALLYLVLGLGFVLGSAIATFTLWLLGYCP